MKQPIRVAVTGPAGTDRLCPFVPDCASGQMFGPDQPAISLQLLEVPVEKVMNALKGVAMELDDCAFPLLHDIVMTSDPNIGFKEGQLVPAGRRQAARGPGMERAVTCSRITARSLSNRERSSTAWRRKTHASRSSVILQTRIA